MDCQSGSNRMATSLGTAWHSQLMLKRKHPKTTDRIKETGGLDTFLLEVEAVEAVEVESFVIFVQRIP